MRYTDAQVRDFLKIVSSKKNYVASEVDKVLLRSYSGCYTCNLSDELISKTWDFFKKEYPELLDYDERSQVTILDTNAGSGRFIENAPDSCSIEAYFDTYNGKLISDLLNQSKKTDSTYASEVFDISNFFINGDNGNTKKYDIVITRLEKDNDYYKGVDGTDLSSLEPTDYHVARSLDFVAKGGLLCVVCNKTEADKFLRNEKVKKYSDLEAKISPINSKLEYISLILKKK